MRTGSQRSREDGRYRVLRWLETFHEYRTDSRNDEESLSSMGFLTLFSKPAPKLLQLPSGSLTADRNGAVLVGTVPSNFPAELLNDIAARVLAAFREAQTAQLPLAELIINYPSLKITARELRGGAIIFLSPRTPYAPSA